MPPTTISRKLTIDDILDLRAYEKVRAEKKAEVIETKRRRRIELGTVVTVMFESRDTMWYQIQEMLRAERVISDEGVLDELRAYNPLIPEAGQLCATIFIELTSGSAMREWLPKLVGIERSLRIRLANGRDVAPVTDEQHDATLTRDNVTAAVHYIRFEFGPEDLAAFAEGPVQLLCTHPNYLEAVELAPFTVAELAADLGV
ncbi:MAG: DUF3501 family protein [Actinobacteria bacterium]|nr:DUF3501 family protein [Actinomycetota bacterium]